MTNGELGSEKGPTPLGTSIQTLFEADTTTESIYSTSSRADHLPPHPQHSPPPRPAHILPHARKALRPSYPYEYHTRLSSLVMRTMALSIFSALALSSSAYAAPLAITTVINIPPFFPHFTVVLNGPSEIPNLAVPTKMPDAAHAVTNIAHGPAERRNVDFRQADYGTSPSAIFEAIAPVQEAATSPSSTAASVAHSRRSATPVDPAAAYAPPKAPAIPTPSHAALSANKKEPASDAALDPASLASTSPPVHPDFSPAFFLSGSGLRTAAASRYQAADSFHSLLGSFFGGNSSAAPSSAAIPQANTGAPNVASALSPSSLVRRFIRDARHASSAMRDAVKRAVLAARHSFELNTDAVLPSRPMTQVDYSDPYAVEEDARRKRVGFVNIDSNRPGERPEPLPQPEDLQPEALDKAEGATGKSGTLQEVPAAAGQAKDKVGGTAKGATGDATQNAAQSPTEEDAEENVDEGDMEGPTKAVATAD